MRFLIVISFLLVAAISSAQDLYLDSLYTELDQCETEVQCTKTLFEIGNYQHIFRLSFWDSIVESCEGHPELNIVKGESHNIIGIISDYTGKRENAEANFHKAIEIFKTENDSTNLSVAIWNLAVHYQDMGNYVKTLELMNQSLDICLKLNTPKQIGECYNGLAVTYDYLGNQALSLSYYEKAYSLMLASGDTVSMAYVLTNMATIYSDQDDMETAEEFYLKSNKLLSSSGNTKTEYYHVNNNNLATIYNQRGETEKALKIIEDNLSFYKKIENFAEYNAGLLNLAKIHAHMGMNDKADKEFEEVVASFSSLEMNYEATKSKAEYAKFLLKNGKQDKGIKLALEAHQFANEINALELVYETAEILSEGYLLKGNYKEAYSYQKKHEELGDQLLNEKTKKATIGQQYQIAYITKVAADSIKNLEKEKLQQAELAAEKAEKDKLKIESQQRRQQNIFLFIGLALTALFGLFIFNRFHLTRKQKSIIEDQKKQVDKAYLILEEKNQEILDSINYAKRIQTALLPSTEKWNELLPNAFVLYLPKDIVAGDFYWLKKSDSKVLFAAADCTGHGVPGAMVSVVCNNGLNKAVNELKITTPNEILDQTKSLIVEEFSKSNEEVKDGMDIALCSLEKKDEDSYNLEFSGANNPLWIIRKDSLEVEEIKGDKQPIGKSDHASGFTNHQTIIRSGDLIYVFTDGYADQFGGERGKKLKSVNFKKKLIEIKDLSVDQQQKHLANYFKEWKFGYEQVDDVCVIGLRV